MLTTFVSLYVQPLEHAAAAAAAAPESVGQLTVGPPGQPGRVPVLVTFQVSTARRGTVHFFSTGMFSDSDASEPEGPPQYIYDLDDTRDPRNVQEISIIV
eukprot:457694-Hanusia_phi.AAC.1